MIYFDKLKEKLILLVILLLAFITRFYNYLNGIFFYPDSARDYLVGLHFLKYNETLTVGHASKLTNSSFYYPPDYYYLISIILRISDNFLFLQVVFTLLGIISIYLLYLIGKQLYGRKVALLAALFYSLSDLMIKESRTIYSAYFVVPIFLLSLLLLLYYRKDHQINHLLVSVALLDLGSLIHHQLLAFIPIYLLWIFFWKTSFKQYIVVVFMTIMLWILGIFPLIKFFGIQKIVDVFSPINNLSIRVNIIEKISMLNGAFYGNLNGNNYFFTGTIIFLLSFLLIFRKESARKLLFPLSFILSLFILAIYKPANIKDYYLSSLYPLLFLIISFLILENYILFKNRSWKGVIFLASCLFFVSLVNSFSALRPHAGNYLEAERISEAILEEIETISINTDPNVMKTFQVIAYVNNKTNEWRSTKYWYFLETMTNQKLLETVNYGSNLKQTNSDNYIFLICELYPKKEIESCLKIFKNKHPNHYLIKAIKIPGKLISAYLYKKIINNGKVSDTLFINHSRINRRNPIKY